MISPDFTNDIEQGLVTRCLWPTEAEWTPRTNFDL